MAENGHGRRIAISIGTNEYAKMGKLEFAENDAREMGKVLLDPDICGFDEVIELINKNMEEVSQRINKVFKNAKQDDEVLIYYSGHGKPGPNFDFLYLLFKNSDPEILLSTALKFDYINDCKAESACKRVVVILDCCYSGTAGMKGDDLEETLSKYSSGSGTILLTSTGQIGSNIAKEDKELKHGIFTNYLLKGLRDWAADHDDDGIITVDELYNYIYNITEGKGLQRPQKKGSYQGEMILARNRPKMKDKEFELKKKKLMEYLSSDPTIMEKSIEILNKKYNNPSSMEPFEEEIYRHLDNLLKGNKGKTEADICRDFVEFKVNEHQKQRGKIQDKGGKQPEKYQIYQGSLPLKKKLMNFSGKRTQIVGIFVFGVIVGALLMLVTITHGFSIHPLEAPALKPPVASFSASVTSGKAELPVNFTSHSTGDPDHYLWIFEPVTSSDWHSFHAVTARHTFKKPGEYAVYLVVINDAGNNTSKEPVYINVTDNVAGNETKTTP